ncbi:MAG: uncharacterized protein QG620_101 [Patescibacteria group bacterium]|nr:uncharacterized protein [Patescibacteria group bacterium]
MKNMSGWDWTALVLLIVGGLNWGLVGFFGFDLIAAIFGEMTGITRIIYAIVGIAALYGVAMPFKMSSGEYTMSSGAMKGA